MVDPLTALLVTGLLFGGLFLLFRPDTGYFWQLRRGLQNTQRVLMEDALKHIYDCEYNNIPCTWKSLSGALSISTERTTKLLSRLQSRELVQSDGRGIALTDQGRAYALRIIRVHRLWEKYLADETGVSEMEWHPRAEKKEHQISTSEAEELAAQMGNPRFDPHGDPIPTASGDIPPMKGISLPTLSKGEFAQIIHIEDEPETVYAQIVAEGLHVGMKIQMLDATSERVQFVADGEEVVLAPLIAANITVLRLPEEPEEITSQYTLSDLKPGERGVVVGISKAVRGLQKRRLMDLGLLPGT
ncbi:MAG: hypothetical protein GWN16_01495, partial [Calditrichae bacterium]|nr:hypothetical protein [Calditrichia bacterium]NIW78197.1 hypothetical protein [Calditrichia bacterium]